VIISLGEMSKGELTIKNKNMVSFCWVGRCYELRILLKKWKRLLAWDPDIIMPFD